MAQASFQTGCEDPIEFNIRDGESLNDAWKRIAPEYGADPNRPVTFKAGGALLSGSATPQPGQVIVAEVSLESKGTALAIFRVAAV